MPTILITGANRGIGLELTRQYADDGWTIFACCRSPENAHELNKLADGFGDRGNSRDNDSVNIYSLDVTNTAQRTSLATQLKGRPIDILCNNAAVSGDWDKQGFGQCQAHEWLEVLHTNVVAPMLMMQDFVENVAASERKIIANMSSLLGSISQNLSGGRYLYGPSKAALNMINMSCAHDLAERAITVVALHPGWVRTDMGGPEATLSIEESVTALRKNLAGITFSDSGRFIDIDGATIPW
uniref:NAD(P)-dependent dehydrogenase, short-chain alcohol dehydrogenase family n=1 Tax=Candidatus Kentrum sp. FM TaxID=2126340 RepID=A0A450SQD9_9GAMM|nr:MAG: NAD(P)-dependent dehydrogenase, short-chain alcohol dehydrogenase family [Candidatus Kentron sp. FM]VFJ56246.1 MAG: NAD(P)-dependent dehydrogenase, short-chain alcohol dehydrogenase family [Candidatus Kentron sp. FM]VFK10156.1 MAG: NAD(P)-dependent dehydrogenase, short-chain alcohol dehydrogenase family [Candidatus Kentron sp. FM]